MTNKTIMRYIVLSLVTGLGAFLTYQPHLHNPLPLLADEYVHLSLAAQLLDGTLPFTNPYLATPTPHTNYQSGFHFFLAGLLILTPGDPVLIYKYLATIGFIGNALLLFYLVRLWSKSYTTAIATLLFFGTITSTQGLLAHQYFVPLTLGVSLLLVSHILLYKFLTKQQPKYLVLLGGALLLAALTYPPVFFFFIITAIAYLLAIHRNLGGYIQIPQRQVWRVLVPSIVLIAAAFLGILSYFNLLGEVVFSASWARLSDNYSPIFFFGLVPSLLALVGLWQVVQNKYSPARIIVYWFLYALTAIYLFYLFGYSVLVPFPRLFFFYLIAISILAGYGTHAILQFVRSRQKRWSRYLLLIPLGIMLSIHISDATQATANLPTILTPAGHQTLTKFADNHPQDALVISDALTSIAVYPVAGNKVLNVLASNIGGGDSDAVRQFLQAPCSEKKVLWERFNPYIQSSAVQNNPFFVISKSAQNCDFLTLLPESSTDLLLYRLSSGTLAEFQITARMAQIPSPIDSPVLPDGAIGTQEEVSALLVGNTLDGGTWKEYYHPDGTSSGIGDSPYTGVWSIIDTFFCFFYNSDSGNVPGCRSMTKDHQTNEMKFYTLDGRYRSSAIWYAGNPFDL